jgi:hypothetical protein
LLLAIPEIRAIRSQHDRIQLRLGRLVVASAICATYVLIGSCAAPLLDADEFKEALLYGFAGEGFLAGVVRTATA